MALDRLPKINGSADADSVQLLPPLRGNGMQVF
jgi:hypothetical protein